MHTQNSFITLTYDQEHVPNDGGLRVEDFQRFCKRLRKAVGSFRFYHCGEYGSKNFRPHYHALLFGQDFASDRVRVQEKPYAKYRSPLLDKVWGMGRTDIGDVTYASAAYVARYVHKPHKQREAGLDDPRFLRVDTNTGECWQVRPEYSTMSRGGRGGQGGIGSSWLKKFHKDVYPSDEVVHDGMRFPVPRFYDAKVVSFDSVPGSPAFSDLVEEAKAARRRSAEERKEDSTGERLEVRERCAVARLRLRQREL